ncbi:uncharacterized protein ACWYII_002798 isoform 3-T8 [Salvelinus alpinus]
MDSQGSGVTHQRKCDICVGRIHKAVKFCKDCKVAYCEDHVRDHEKVPGLMQHTLVDATDDHGHVEIERTSAQVGLRKKTLGLLWILIPSLLGLGRLWYHMSPTVDGKVRLDMRIVLLGKTGSGKSSTGNTILGREAFRAEASPVSVTTQCEKQNVVIGQNRITVIDTPGILGTLLQPDEVMVKTAECINTTPHAFLLVTRLGEFTDEDRKSVQWIQEHFGEEALKYTIVLFTGVDQLEGKPVEMFIKGSSHLLQVINSCGDRYHVFNNKDKKDHSQVSELLEKIEELLNEYRGYHHEADLLTQERVREEDMRKKERAQIIQEEGIKREAAVRNVREEEEKKREAAEIEIREEEEKKRDAAEREIREEEEKKREAAEREIRVEEEKKRYAAEREIREEEEKKRDAAEREIREEEEKKREAAEREIREEEEKKRDAAEREIREEEEKKRDAAEREIREEEEKKRDAAEREIREEEEKKRKELNDLALKDVEKSSEKISDSGMKFKLAVLVTIVTFIIFCYLSYFAYLDINKEYSDPSPLRGSLIADSLFRGFS